MSAKGMHFSGRRKFWFCFLAAALFLVPVIFLILPSREPMYEGKSLSYWLDQLPAVVLDLKSGGEAQMIPGIQTSSTKAEQDDAAERREIAIRALHSIGVTRLPELAARLRYKPSPLKTTLLTWGLRLRLIKRDQYFQYYEREMNSGQALTALIQLGPLARPIVPQLLAMAEDPDPYTKALARRALTRIAPEELAKLPKQ